MKFLAATALAICVAAFVITIAPACSYAGDDLPSAEQLASAKAVLTEQMTRWSAQAPLHRPKEYEKAILIIGRAVVPPIQYDYPYAGKLTVVRATRVSETSFRHCNARLCLS